MCVVEGAGDLDSRMSSASSSDSRPFRESSGQRVALEALHDEKIDIVMTSRRRKGCRCAGG